jgi:CheY-like chemotaxis protein
MKDYADRKILVLVIEEQQEILDKAVSALAAADYSTCCATSSEKALAAAAETPPDLIIADVGLTDISGMELCEQIRRIPGLESVPVMYLSGGQIPDIIRRHDQMGGSYHIRKPFDPDVLVELIDKTLQMPVMT